MTFVERTPLERTPPQRKPLVWLAATAWLTCAPWLTGSLAAQQLDAPSGQTAGSSPVPTIVVRPTLSDQHTLDQCAIDLQPSSDGQGYVLQLEVPPSVSRVELTPRSATGVSRAFQIRMEEVGQSPASPIRSVGHTHTAPRPPAEMMDNPFQTPAAETPKTSPAVDKYIRTNPFFEAQLIGTHDDGQSEAAAVAVADSVGDSQTASTGASNAVWTRLSDFNEASSSEPATTDRLTVTVATTPPPGDATVPSSYSVLEPLAPAELEVVDELSGIEDLEVEWSGPIEVRPDEVTTYGIQFAAGRFVNDQPVTICLSLPEGVAIEATDYLAKIYDDGRTIHWQIDPASAGESIEILYQLRFPAEGQATQQLSLEQGAQRQDLGQKETPLALATETDDQ